MTTKVLARVTHIHCHQRDINEPATFVWIPSDMTKDEFKLLVGAARDAYDKAGEEFQKANEPPYCSWGMPDYKKHPEKTVAEVEAIYNAQREKYEAWRKLKEEAQANFANHLVAVGGGRVESFWKNASQFDVVLDWGHRHGQRVAHGETKLRDLPGTVEREDED